MRALPAPASQRANCVFCLPGGFAALTSVAILLIGFSIPSAIVLSLTHFRGDQYRELRSAQVAGLVLLLALSLLQLAHYAQLAFGQQWTDTTWYRVTLFVVAPSFFLFSRPILAPQGDDQPTWSLGLHAAPVLGALAIPASLALPLAFLIGAGYLGWLARRLFALRGDRAAYRVELVLLGAVFAVALGAAVLGLLADALADRLFLSLYGSAIGLAFFLVQVALGLRPQLSVDVRETAQAAYANTTLAKVDCEGALARLESLMVSERLFADPELSLAGLADRLGLSAHQLSELVNSRLGKGFSRYLREHRVDAAKAMLLAEPKASVLSVGLSVGFTSQSNFYQAFREIEGSTPGQYRKLKAELPLAASAEKSPRARILVPE